MRIYRALDRFEGALFLRRGNKVAVLPPKGGKHKRTRTAVLHSLVWLITNPEAKELYQKVVDTYIEHLERQQGIERS